MSIEWLLYLIDLVSHLCCFMVTILAIAIIGTFVSFVAWQIDFNYSSEESIELRDKRIKTCATVFFIASIVCVSIPSEKTMYAIALAHYSKQSDIPSKVLKAIEVKLDDIIKFDSAQK